MSNLLIRAFLFLSLIVIVNGRPNGDETFALAAFMLICVVSFFEPSKRRVELKPLAAPFLFSLVSVFTSRYVVVMDSVLKVFVALIAIKVIGERFDMNLKTVGWWALSFVILSLAVLGLQYLGIEPLYFPKFEEAAGMSFRPWILGSSVCMAIPFIARIHPALCLLTLPLLWASRSSACILIGILAFGLVIILDKKKISMLWIAAIFIFAVFFVLSDSFDHNRIEVWVNSFKHLENLWIGRGFGTWAHSAFIHQASPPDGEYLVWIWAHNEFYQHFFEQGFIGLALLIVATVFAFTLAQSSAMKSAVITIFLLSQVHPIFHWGKLAFFACCILAFALAEKSEAINEGKLI